MSKITTTLWFDMNGEEAANFYVSLLPDSRIDGVMKAPADNPSGPATRRIHARGAKIRSAKRRPAVQAERKRFLHDHHRGSS
jgi:predicted 3-demethylubiquinone-9 3-methyltransferase (glyoxalase superfamily)